MVAVVCLSKEKIRAIPNAASHLGSSDSLLLLENCMPPLGFDRHSLHRGRWFVFVGLKFASAAADMMRGQRIVVRHRSALPMGRLRLEFARIFGWPKRKERENGEDSQHFSQVR